MGWLIRCTDKNCTKQTWAENIVELIDQHTDQNGWIKCGCGQYGYIKKVFELQEEGETWEPFLRAVIRLGEPGDTYQPFVFLVSYDPLEKPQDVWFSYYKDLRQSGGRLKLGYGPGGPPVLGTKQVVGLLQKLVELGCISGEELETIENANLRNG
jgi:hypothetical protein